MVIYAEYLFAENFITGILILVITGRTCGIAVKKKFLVLGGVLCGLFSFTIGIENMPDFISVIIKLGFSMVVVLLVYSPKTRVAFGKILVCFYIISFALGGITIGCMYFLGTPGMTNNSFIYLEGLTYLNITLGCVVAFVLLDQIVRYMKERIISTKGSYRVEIIINNKSMIVDGIVDTGNYLVEPISGYPVFILSKSLANALFGADIKEQDGMATKIRMIPFHAIGGKKGMLTGVKPEAVILRDETAEIKLENVYLGINESEFFNEAHGKQYSILLHRDVLDRGINDNEKQLVLENFTILKNKQGKRNLLHRRQ